MEELDGNFFRRSTVDNKRINPSNELAFEMQKSRDERLMSDNQPLEYMNQTRSPNGTVRSRRETKKSRKAAGSTKQRTESMKSVSELSISSNGSFLKDGTRI